LLVFSRQESLQPADLDLNEVIGDLIKMLRRVIPENVELTVAPGAELWRVYADPGQIEQVLMNLCVNARDAMPHGGRLTIETGTIHISADYCQSHPWAREGQFVWLSVTDTGVGIPPDVQEHIFEPFFTTKEVGEGTGLGLATVYGIVKQHEGIINVYSEPGHGTAFRVYLPASKAARAQPGPRAEMEHVAGGSETILLAEDDELVRNLAISILRRAGYRVLSARDGQEAMDMLDRQTELDLAILDVIMPRRGGREVCTALRRRMPRVPVLFCSGYSYTAMAADQLPQGARLIQKPYGANELLRNVRDLLDSASGDEAPG
jgi:CheY-like chemotaxis protein